MDNSLEGLRGLLEGRGFRVTVRRERYGSLTGGQAVVERLTATSRGVRLSAAREVSGWRLTLIAVGDWDEDEAEGLESLGGSVEVEEDRILAVFTRVPDEEVEQLVASILDRLTG